MESETGLESKRMRLRYAGRCRVCDVALPAKSEAIYERATKTVRCLSHEPEAARPAAPTTESVVELTAEAEPEPTESRAVDIGTPGASARREHDRRSAKREERIRTKHPKLGGLILAMSDDPQSTKSWGVGAVGEEAVGRRLNELSCDEVRVLHDRRIPGSRANIDHLAVTPTGVWVIDPKRYRDKRPTLKIEGGILRQRVEKLLVGGRDRTSLVDGMLKQVEVVRRVVGDEVPVHGVLVFVDGSWPIIGGSFSTRGVEVLWPRKLYPQLLADGALGLDEIAALHTRLAAALPVA